jgi:hypothetical protein
MSCFCFGRRKLDIQKFTVLLVHVVGSKPPSALRHSTPFAIQLDQEFLKEHTEIDVSELSDRFRNLEVHSRLKIVFKGKPKGFGAPSHAVFTHTPNTDWLFLRWKLELRLGIFLQVWNTSS